MDTRARAGRAISNIIGAVLLVVITVALAVFFYFYTHRFMLATTGNVVTINVGVAGAAWNEGNGTGTFVLDVSVTNDIAKPITIEGLAVLVYTYSGTIVNLSGGNVSATPQVPAGGLAVQGHSTIEFTLLVRSVPAEAEGVSVELVVKLPTGATIYPVSPKVPLSSP